MTTLSRDDVLRIAGEPVAWRAWDDDLSRWDFTLYPDERCNEYRDWQPVYTESQLLAVYAAGAEAMRGRVISEEENDAVRMFLMAFRGNPNLTVLGMRENMECAGFSGCWPEWVNDAEDGEHLTKSGAQHWIRYLLLPTLPITPTSQEGESNEP